MIAGEVLAFPSRPKGEIVDQWFSLMSTQATPRATSILHRNFHLKALSNLSQVSSRWILLVEMFLFIYGTPRNS